MRGGTGGKASIAAASALLAAIFAGPPLLTASATSAALQTSLANACSADVGLVLNIDEAWIPELTEIAAEIANVDQPLETDVAATRIAKDDGSERAIVLSRADATDHLPGVVLPAPTADEVLVPVAYADAADLAAGDGLTLIGGNQEVD